ncbi:Arginine--tRNA ligase [Sulfurovum sp. enrichment culture clone C5]|uniref:Arginine--tRNA ligase n=1 Tax=Sulfurovum sp. enrichment culture clone C5 TaxID=497650 RepID=A0A0S4XQ80_9BACT|nr:Arginine--tRNA ligase [Sulfurovum sp. enrichment culture clone C5]
MKFKSLINNKIQEAFSKIDIAPELITVSDASKPEFGDFQYNGVMAVAKKIGANPRDIASLLAKNIDSDMLSKVEVAGPGFVNIHIDNNWLESQLTSIFKSTNFMIEKNQNPKTILVDYSGPNMAKEMHVGHLRSTIIGDSLANLFEFLGENVIRQNHIGDWGTQFGMLIAYLEEIQQNSNFDELKNLENFYKLAKKRFDEDVNFANKAREYVVKIQSGDKHCLELWQKFIDISLSHCEEVYDKLGINLTKDDVRAESFYNDLLPIIISKLDNSGLLKVSDGAKCIFLPNSEVPVIVQKSDGGYLYATTDLAAINYRNDVLKVDRICYVVDARQSEHFAGVFWTAKESKLCNHDVLLEHIAFGTMMDKSGKPFKTRDGGTVKLIDLLDEAIIRAKDTINDRANFADEEIERLAKTIGIGAVKYSDLSINRESNYIFDWDKMLSFDGNTSLYMQYAYARIQSILNKFNGEISGDVELQSDIEHKLAIMLLSFEDVLNRAANDATPHTITSYLYDLATIFMRFYEQSPILKEDIPANVKMSRLMLSSITARTIKKGLEILGIEVVDRL